MNRDLARYVYGVISMVDGNPFTSFKSNSGEEIYMVTHDGMGCVLRDAFREDYLTLEKEAIAQNLIAHQTVIEEVMKTHTIIPMKFGTFLENEEHVIEILEKGGKLFHELLDTMGRNIELDVVAAWHDVNAVIKEIGETDEAIISVKEEIAENPTEDIFQVQMEVGVLVKRTLDEKRAVLQNELIDGLAELFTAHQIHDLMEDRMIFNCAFLIPKERETEFDTTLGKLDERYKGTIDFRCVGPLPPYSFATCEVRPVDFSEIDRARHLLGLKDRVTAEDIKAAYRNYVRTEHPDKSDNSGAQQGFKEVRAAYETLLDFCSEDTVSFRSEDIEGTFIVRRFDVAATRIYNR